MQEAPPGKFPRRPLFALFRPKGMLCLSHQRKGASFLSFKRWFRAGMCTLCALLFVLNSRGAQHAAADGAGETADVPNAAQVSAAYRRLCELKPDADITSWQYVLCSRGNPVTQEPPLTVRVGGVPVDARIADDLSRMIADARAEGLKVYLSCGYTDSAAQEHIYNRAAEKYGEFRAQSIVGRPEESEHRSGLAVDITDRYYEDKDASLDNTELFVWLRMHSSEYGFILRYPKDKKEVTGMIYQPWHFRYVGAEAAQFMTDNHLALEEFLDLYRFEGWDTP